MKQYRLVKNSRNDIFHVAKTVFENRGIADVNAFCKLDETCLHPYELLGCIADAAACYLKHVWKGSRVHILVDSDVDGYTSAAMLYRYTQLVYPDVILSYSLHSKKQHGLSEDISVPDDIDLLLIPDAGSNDVEQCRKLCEKGIEIIILDHHECDVKNSYAVVVNNQLCEYPNKHLSGAGIVYKFLQAVDEGTWNEESGRFLDLTALGLIADNMDVRELETRHLINQGISRIRSKLFQALVKLQQFSIREPLTGIDVQFYIVPLINGMIRAGDSDEKDLLFRAFIETDEVFPYKKRGETQETDEDIYTRAARLCLNAKTRQNNKSLQPVFDQIEKYGRHKDKIIFVNGTGLIPDTMTGIAAMKIADRYHKPCLLLHKKSDELYGGSGRNIDGCPVKELKDFINDLNIFNFAQGHQGAFGVEIEKNRIPEAIALINERLKDVSFEPVIEADFIVSAEDLSIRLIKELDDLRKFYGTGFQEPVIVAEGIEIYKDQFELMGKAQDSWKVITDENIALVKFRAGTEDLLKARMLDAETVIITAYGKANINRYKGILTCQFIINDYMIEEGS